MAEHTPEPWRTNGDLIQFHEIPVAEMVFGSEQAPQGQRTIGYANARRIVAAVNACTGIPTEALEAGAVARLVEALSHLVWTCTTGDRNTAGKPVGVRTPSIGDVDRARAALAALKGEENPNV